MLPLKAKRNCNKRLQQWTHVTLVASQVSPAGGAIAAGFVLAVVHVLLAVAAGVVGRTLAVVAVAHVDAVASVKAEVLGWNPWGGWGGRSNSRRSVRLTFH